MASGALVQKSQIVSKRRWAIFIHTFGTIRFLEVVAYSMAVPAVLRKPATASPLEFEVFLVDRTIAADVVSTSGRIGWARCSHILGPRDLRYVQLVAYRVVVSTVGILGLAIMGSLWDPDQMNVSCSLSNISLAVAAKECIAELRPGQWTPSTLSGSLNVRTTLPELAARNGSFIWLGPREHVRDQMACHRGDDRAAIFSKVRSLACWDVRFLATAHDALHSRERRIDIAIVRFRSVVVVFLGPLRGIIRPNYQRGLS